MQAMLATDSAAMPAPPLFLVVGAILVFSAIGWVISVVFEMPGEFGDLGDPDNVLAESVTRGTLLAAPLTTLIGLVVLSLLIWRGNRWLRSVGLLGMMILGVLFVVGNLGEPLDPEASDPPLALLLVWRAIGTGLSVSLAALAAAALYRTLRPGSDLPAA